MTAILGISAFYHDSAAALVVDGEVVAAAQEERFTRRKHDHEFPRKAIEYCLREGGLAAEELDYITFYDKPILKFDRLLETYLAFAPLGYRSFVRAMPLWLKKKLHLPRLIRRELGLTRSTPIVFPEHHESHAASAFFPSPFDEAAILTVDAVGEWATASIGVGRGNRLELLRTLNFPHSLGMLYSAFTYYCGFKVNSGEYKLMGLAPYGKPVYEAAILEKLVDLRDDGSLHLDMRYFDYCHGLTMTSARFHDLFDGLPRRPESPILQKHMDLAASIQSVTEQAMMNMAGEAHRLTGSKNLVMAGGVALNCVANGLILRDGPFERIWIQPAAGDAGGSLGAALLVWHQLLENGREPRGRDGQKGSLLGPQFTAEEIAAFLDAKGVAYRHFGAESELLDCVSEALASERIVGWFQGRMEFGPRALGARSILGDARSPSMQATMNLKIKYRESFRPFAPIVLREAVNDWFDLPRGEESPYMLLVAPVAERRRVEIATEERSVMDSDPDLRRRVNVVRSSIPAVTHVDYSARLQTVDAGRNARLHRLMQAFEKKTGCPVLVNTSFNVRGEPIVCTPEDAWRCFQATEIDVLVLGEFVIDKARLGAASDDASREQYLAQFELD